MAGTLFLVATPIGNLGDFTARAKEVLQSVALVICEDTRHSRILLDEFGITTATTSLPAFAEKARIGRLVERLASGEDLALISDAGSPALCDPGEALAAAALAAGAEVRPVPGASALVAALTASGLPASRFHFLGFLPRAAGEAREMLQEVKALRATLAFYESPRRLERTLELAVEVLGEARRACIARELTKIHEEFLRGTLGELLRLTKARELKGEVVLLCEGAPAVRERIDEEVLSERIQAALADGLHVKEAARKVAEECGLPVREVYARALALRGGC